MLLPGCGRGREVVAGLLIIDEPLGTARNVYCDRKELLLPSSFVGDAAPQNQDAYPHKHHPGTWTQKKNGLQRRVFCAHGVPPIWLATKRFNVASDEVWAAKLH
jgi:hypothetical protein